MDPKIEIEELSDDLLESQDSPEIDETVFILSNNEPIKMTVPDDPDVEEDADNVDYN